MLYHSLVAHYTQGLTGRQRIEIIERELVELRLDQKWGKTCESFMNLVDNKLKDHMGIAPDPTQYPDSWYITRLNQTLEPHSTLYQYIVNHQMQADSIASHLRTASATLRLHMNTTLRLSVCSAKASIMPAGRQRKTRTAGKLSKPSSNKVRGEVAVHALGEPVGEVMTTQEGLQPWPTEWTNKRTWWWTWRWTIPQLDPTGPV